MVFTRNFISSIPGVALNKISQIKNKKYIPNIEK